MKIGIILTVVIVAILLTFTITTFNKLTKKKNRVKNAWAQIDVQLQKRFDLVPNLINVVKKSISYESETFEKIVKSRNEYANKTDLKDKISAAEESGKLFNSFFSLHEAYPDLKANSNFTTLMTTLSDLEEQISISRMFYNDTVNSYNDTLMVFPSNIIAAPFNFKEAPLFQGADEIRKNVEVNF